MIKRLRIKFVVMNMSIIAMLLITILGLVFYFTRLNLETESINMIRNIAQNPFILKNPNEISDEVQLPYFILQIGPHREIIATGGNYYDLSNDAFLKDLIDETYQSPKTFGIIKEYKLRYCRFDTPSDQYIVFTDISSELATRRNLIKTCLLLGTLGFLVLLLISIKLSKWAVMPIEAAWKQQKQFISDASHELKAPLTVIIINMDLLQSNEYGEENKAQFLNNIAVTSRNMKGLVEQMLELARSDHVEDKTSFHLIDFDKLISDSILPFEAIFFEKGLALDTSITHGICVMGEENKLRQAMDILLDNAYKYSNPHGATHVTLVRKEAKYCLLTVQNEGSELSEDEARHIFKRFYCVDKSRHTAGSFGLGLSIAENIVTQHRGKIWAESKNGSNYFYVELPCHMKP